MASGACERMSALRSVVRCAVLAGCWFATCVGRVAQSPFAAIGDNTQCSRLLVGTLEKSEKVQKKEGDGTWHADCQ